jgi:hypothetical protein
VHIVALQVGMHHGDGYLVIRVAVLGTQLQSSSYVLQGTTSVGHKHGKHSTGRTLHTASTG